MLYLKKSIFIFLFSILGFLFLPLISFGTGDLLDKGFEKAKDSSNVVKKKGSKVVGNKDSMLIKTSKLMLRITVVVGVSMIIIVGIYFLLSLGDESKMKSARNALFYVALGIVLALSSIAIIYLLNSVVSTINI